VDPLPASPAPIEAFLRSAELQLAALLVALVVIPGAVNYYEDRTARPVDNSGPAPAARKGLRGRHIRTPRSC
jgi:hypothetical protein